MEVTTAELAAMSSDALRQAVSRGRHVDEFEKELGLVKRMNQMLMEQIEEMKDKLAKEKEKRQVGGVAHENGRLEEDPEDDELPRLRLANEALLTRQHMLEAQVYEAARYNETVASDLAQSKQQLKAQMDVNSRLESKNAQLAYDIEVLQATSNTSRMSPRGKNGALRYSSSSSHNHHSLSPEAIAQLEAENRELSERVGQLQDKCESRKTEVKNLRANVTFMKAKMTELTAKVQSNEAVNDAALQKLKQHLASPPDSPNHSGLTSSTSDMSIPGFSAALGPDGTSSAGPEEPASICGILDSEQLELLENAKQELVMLGSSINQSSKSASLDENATVSSDENSGPARFSSLREYFNSKLDLIDATSSGNPNGIKLNPSGATLHTIAEDSSSTPSGSLRASGSVPVSTIGSSSSAPGSTSLKSSSSQVSLQTAGSKWHEYDASFLVLSTMLIQKLASTSERLGKKRRELTDLQEDFNEYKRSQASQTPRSAAGSRKMSAEAQQITLQKKMNELEKSVQSLTVASNEKENALVSVRAEMAQLSADLESKSSNLDEASAKCADLAKEAEEKAKELQEKDAKLAEAKDAEELLKAEAASLLASISDLENQSSQTSAQLQESKDRCAKLEEDAEKSALQITEKNASISSLEEQVREVKAYSEDSKTKLEENITNLKAERDTLTLAGDAKKEELEKKMTEIEAQKAEIEAFTAKCANYAEEVKSSKASLEATQNDLAAKSQEVSKLSQDIEKLAAERKTQIEEIQASKELLKATETQLEETKSLLGDKSNEVLQLSASIEILTKERDAQIEEIKAVKATLASTEMELSTAQNELATKSNEISQLSQEVSQLKTDKSTQQDEIKTITASLAATTQELDETKTSLTAKSAESSQRSQEVEQLKAAAETQKDELSVTKSSLSLTETQLEETKQSLATKTDESSQLSKEVEQLKKDKETQSGELSTTISSLSSTETQLEETKQSLAVKTDESLQLSQEVEQLKKDKETQAGELSTTKSSLSSTETQLEETKQSLANKSSEASDLSNEVNQLKTDNQVQAEEIKSVKSSLTSTEAQLEETKHSLANKSNEAAELIQRVESLSQSKESLEQTVKETKSALEAVESALTETESQLATKTADGATLSEKVSQLTTAQEDHLKQISSLQERLATTESNLEDKKSELSAALSSSEQRQSELNSEISKIKAELQSTNSQLEATSAKLVQTESSLASLTTDHSSKVDLIATLEKDKQSQSEQISALETQRSQLEEKLDFKTKEASSLTQSLADLQAAKDGEISKLTTDLASSAQESEQRREKIVSLETDLLASTTECARQAANIASLEASLASETNEKDVQIEGRAQAERDASETKVTLAQLQTTTAQSITLLEQSLHAIENERSGLLVRIEEAKRVEDNMHTEILGLQIKARELDAWQKKLPEITDESLEAEERAATKWLEYTINKEKATTSHNSFATFLNQVAHGTQSPSSAAQLAAGGASSVRKITKLGDALRHPSFLASVINLVKKDAFNEATIKKMEEIEVEQIAASVANISAPTGPSSSANPTNTSSSVANAGAAGQGSVAGPSESEALRALEECLSVARSIGLKVNGVTGALLFQGNRRAIVDFAMEVIRTVTTSRATVRAHPELSLLFVGMDEDKMNAKPADKVLIKWVNSFIEDFNATFPELSPPRPFITNLGRDLSDGRALGIVMAAINKDWAPLADTASLDLMRKIINSLQQTVWIHRSIPPFVDSPIPIMRGDENVITILLAQLLEYNTGLSSPLAKMSSLHSSSATASMLSATTPSRNQIRAVSGATMNDSPMKTPTAARGALTSVTSLPSTSGAVTTAATTGRNPANAYTSTTTLGTPGSKASAQNISIKPVEEASRWKFWG